MTRFPAGARHAVKLPLSLKVSYGTGQVIEGAVTQVLNLFLLYYLTMACGISGAVAGFAISLGIVVDAFLDPFIGSSSDACHSRFGRRLPYMLFGGPAAALFLALTFSLPAGLSDVATFLWIAATSIGLRTSLAVFTLPYQAAGAEITDDADERSQLVAFRFGIGVFAGLVAAFIGFAVYLNGPTGLADRNAYRYLALTTVVGMLIAVVFSSRAVWLTRTRQHHAPVQVESSLRRLRIEMRQLFSNPTFREIFFGALLLFIAIGTNSTLLLHTAKFFWELSAEQIPVISLVPLLGLLVGAPFAAPLLKRYEKASVLRAGLIGLAVAQGGPATLRLIGLLDATGTNLVLVLCAFSFFGYALISTAAIAFGSMLADASDEHELLFGVRQEGLFFASWSFASKCAIGVGTLISGLVLHFINLPRELPTQAVLLVASESSITWLAVTYGPFTALLIIVSVMTFKTYRLDRRKHAAILVELNVKRNAAAY